MPTGPLTAPPRLPPPAQPTALEPAHKPLPPAHALLALQQLTGLLQPLEVVLHLSQRAPHAGTPMETLLGRQPLCATQVVAKASASGSSIAGLDAAAALGLCCDAIYPADANCGTAWTTACLNGSTPNPDGLINGLVVGGADAQSICCKAGVSVQAAAHALCYVVLQGHSLALQPLPQHMHACLHRQHSCVQLLLSSTGLSAHVQLL